MARPELLGTMPCPECDFPDAEVRNDKAGNPYRYCPDCCAQYFSRGDVVRVRNLLAKVRALAKPAPAATPKPVPRLEDEPPVVPAVVPAAPARPARAGGTSCLLDDY